jgi:pimeloyl-ACP methyl ester carboxylesterase
MTPLHVREIGKGPRVVLVHGAMLNAARTWSAQEELAERWRLVLPDRRGFAPNPPDAPSDFERDADDLVDLLAPTAHLVGHSYGAVVALLMAAAAPDKVLSLTVVEPPVRQLARGVAEVEDAIARHEGLVRLDDPDPVYRGMLRALGAPEHRRPLTELERRHVRLLIGERRPWEAELPLDALRAAKIPCLILTGGHDRVFELVADRLGGQLGPVVTRMVLRGAGHAVQRAPEFNETVQRFWCLAQPCR